MRLLQYPVVKEIFRSYGYAPARAGLPRPTTKSTIALYAISD